MTEQQSHRQQQPQQPQQPQQQPQAQQHAQAQAQYPQPQQQQYPQPQAQEQVHLPSLYLELLQTEQTEQQSTLPRPSLLQAQPYVPLQMQQFNPPQPQVQQPYSQLQVYVPPLIQPQPQDQSREHPQPAYQQQPQVPHQQQPPFPQLQPNQSRPASPSATARAPQTPNPRPTQSPKKKAKVVVGIVAGSVGFLLMLATLAIVFILPLWHTAPTWVPQPVVSREDPPVSPPSTPEPNPEPADELTNLTEYVADVVGPSLADRANMDPEGWVALERAALEEATQKTGATAQTAFFEGTFVNDYHFDVFEFRADGTFSWYKDLDAYANAYNNFYAGTYAVYPVARATDGLDWLDSGYITRNSAGEMAQTIVLNADTFFDADGNVNWYYDWTFCLSAYLASEKVGDGFYALNSATTGGMQGYVRFDDNMLAIKRLMMNLDGSQDTIALPWG
jgi:hypothetical protein